MSIRVVGAGLYRTGTKSLKAALERPLGNPSYHMAEVFVHPEHIPICYQAALGRMPDWGEFLRGYSAALDAPAAYFWPEWDAMNDAISSSRFATSTDTREAAIRGFNLHHERVRSEVERDRLLEWTARDGWEPICSALGVPVPDEPFPHTNSREERAARERARTTVV